MTVADFILTKKCVTEGKYPIVKRVDHSLNA